MPGPTLVATEDPPRRSQPLDHRSIACRGGWWSGLAEHGVDAEAVDWHAGLDRHGDTVQRAERLAPENGSFRLDRLGPGAPGIELLVAAQRPIKLLGAPQEVLGDLHRRQLVRRH